MKKTEKKSTNSKLKSSLSKVSSLNPDVFHYVVSRGVKVYPVSLRGVWYIQIDDNGKVRTYDKPVHKDDIQTALTLSIIRQYDRLTATKQQMP